MSNNPEKISYVGNLETQFSNYWKISDNIDGVFKFQFDEKFIENPEYLQATLRKCDENSRNVMAKESGEKAKTSLKSYRTNFHKTWQKDFQEISQLFQKWEGIEYECRRTPYSELIRGTSRSKRGCHLAVETASNRRIRCAD